MTEITVELEAVARAIESVEAFYDGAERKIRAAQAAITALDKVRPVNQEMLEALKKIADYQRFGDYQEAPTELEVVARIAKQAILSAESGKGEV